MSHGRAVFSHAEDNWRRALRMLAWLLVCRAPGLLGFHHEALFLTNDSVDHWETTVSPEDETKFGKPQKGTIFHKENRQQKPAFFGGIWI